MNRVPTLLHEHILWSRAVDALHTLISAKPAAFKRCLTE